MEKLIINGGVLWPGRYVSIFEEPGERLYGIIETIEPSGIRVRLSKQERAVFRFVREKGMWRYAGSFAGSRAGLVPDRAYYVLGLGKAD